jgi:leucyl aminopeptidase (aminopeptidase T)
MIEKYEFEIGKAADILVRELLKIRTGEILVITADTNSDMRVVIAAARAAFSVGAKPMVIWLASPPGIGKVADPELPQKSLTSALKEADAWVEFNSQALTYSTTWDVALEENKRLRYLGLCSMDVDMMVRCIGRTDYQALREFQTKLFDMTKKAKKVRIVTAAGCNVTFENEPTHPLTLELGYADTPGPHFMAGQIAWLPKLGTINGSIVFDGSLWPPLGLLKESVKLTIREDRIVDIEGGREAAEFKKWLNGFGDPNMFLLAHVCYGVHPGAKLSGITIEDERVWGCTVWGIGNVGPMLLPPKGRPAKSHTDGICLNSSIYLDDIQIFNEGLAVHPELRDLAIKLGKGYIE